MRPQVLRIRKVHSRYFLHCEHRNLNKPTTPDFDIGFQALVFQVLGRATRAVNLDAEMMSEASAAVTPPFSKGARHFS
jgi:hypothetical protein